MCNEKDAITAYLEKWELYMDVFRLGNFVEIADPVIANHRLILLVDNGRGFSYPIIMPWTEKKDPEPADIVRFMKETDEKLDPAKTADSGNPAAEHLVNNGEQIAAAGFARHLRALGILAGL